MPQKKWKNSYPIVLVHGFGGYVPDESILLGDYFAYATETQGDNVVYQADVSPWASLHDRACELYQQLVGIKRVRKQALANGYSLPRQVYGSEHFDAEHPKQTKYKP